MPFFSSENFHKLIKLKTNAINDDILETVEMHILELPKLNPSEWRKLTKEEAWGVYLKGNNSELVKRVKAKFKHIKELDELLEKYWEEEKI